MIFTLVDNSGKGLRFKPAADEAMWVRHGKGCPSGKGSANGQITYVSVSNGGMTLTVNDDNSGNPARLHYMLRFDPDPNVFDPEIRNGGGGGFAKSASITSAAAGAVIGAGAAFFMSDAGGATNLLFGLIVGAVAGYVLWAVAGAMR